MAKITLAGVDALTESGGVVTLPAAIVVDAAALTGALPAGVTGGSGLTALGTVTSGDVSAIAPAGGGITHASTWDMSSAVTVTGGEYNFSGWTKSTGQSRGYMGTDMSHSSGHFTFPTTGIWYVTFHITFSTGTTTARYIEAHIQTTVNDSTWVEASRKMINHANVSGSADYDGVATDSLFNVAATGTHKMRFGTYVYSSAGTSLGIYTGSGAGSYTYATFIRLGDA